MYIVNYLKHIKLKVLDEEDDRLFLVDGKEMGVAGLSTYLGIRPNTVKRRIKNGWTFEDAFGWINIRKGIPSPLTSIEVFVVRY